MNLPKLIDQTITGCAQSQKCLYVLYSEKMLALCGRYVKNREDAEEISQDGFRAFFKHLPSFDYKDEAGLESWVKRIMINKCLMFLRTKNGNYILTEITDEEIAIEEEAFINLSVKELFKLVLLLPVGYRTVFNLYAVEGYSHKEIAELLKISVKNSQIQLNRAKALLQKKLLSNETDHEKFRSK